MAWQEVQLMVDVGTRFKSVLDSKPLFRLGTYTSSMFPDPTDHDRMKENPGVEDDREEFDPVWDGEEDVEELRSGPPSIPTRFPSEPDRRTAGSKPINDDYILFPSYDDSPRRRSRSESLSLINSCLPPALAIMMSHDALDDTYLQHPPTRQVDYLSHDWIEEDIWASWKQAVAERLIPSTHQPRLENATWRTWAKKRSNLATLPSETINWIKDEDVTWLYGPLHTTRRWNSESLFAPAIQESLEFPRPILKTPSLQEVLLQRSVSDLALVRLPLSSVDGSGTLSRSLSPSFPTDSRSPPSVIHARIKSVSFHDEVAQCIAINTDHVLEEHSITCAEDDFLSIQRPSYKGVRRSSSPLTSTKTIELLPSTTLKPEALTPQPRGILERAKSWPSRTLSYLWDQTNTAVSQEDNHSSKQSQVSIPDQFKSSFEEDEEDQVEWNPPRPRRIIAKEECSVTSAFIQNPLPQTPFLTDDESFEIEMFGFPLKKNEPRSSIPADEDLDELHSNRSSPSISEYLSNSYEDLEELEFPPSIFSVASLKAVEDRTSSPFEDSDSSSASNESIPPPKTPCGDLDFGEQGNYFASYTLPKPYSSAMVKDRAVHTTCSPELNAIYGANNFDLQRSSSMEAGMTVEDEEHWWANV